MVGGGRVGVGGKGAGAGGVQGSARGAAGRGRFGEWWAKLAREGGGPGGDRMAEWARGLGMDPVRFTQSMAEHRHRGRIEADTAEAVERGVAGGAVVMNGTPFRGEQT